MTVLLDYQNDASSPSFESYSKALLDSCPELFEFAVTSKSIASGNAKWRLATEFGKSIVTKTGFVVARIEDVLCHNRDSTVTSCAVAVNLKSDPKVTAITHAGADLFLRQCYCPGLIHVFNNLHTNVNAFVFKLYK